MGIQAVARAFPEQCTSHLTHRWADNVPIPVIFETIMWSDMSTTRGHLRPKMIPQAAGKWVWHGLYKRQLAYLDTIREDMRVSGIFA